MKNYINMSKIKSFISYGIIIVGIVLPLGTVNATIFEPGFEVETLTGGFALPTSMAFAPDGRIFVAEKGGRVLSFKGESYSTLITLTDVNTFGDRGLLGIAVDPNFADNGYLYLAYTFENTPGSNFSGPKTGRIVRVTVVNDVASESSKVVLVGSVGGSATTPSCEDYPVGADCIPSDSMSHSMGGLQFGPDGYLYATLGDGSSFDTVDPRAMRAQDLNSLAGKVIRINKNGTAPSSNPFFNGDPDSNRSKVFAIGVRNAFRFSFNENTGALFAGDVGWSDWEEINLITSGANYGWPCREGLGATSYNCEPSSSTDPKYAYPHDQNGAGSIVAGSFPSNAVYPLQYNNTLWIGDYAQNWIKLAEIDGANNITSVRDFMDNPDGPVAFATGPDGNIYYLSIYNGELRRITHTDGNRHPVVNISASQNSGLLPLEVNFSSAGSYDPDSDPVTYNWNFGDGAFSTDPNPIHVYTTSGTYIATLTLTDIHGSEVSRSTTIFAGNQKPIPLITSPANGSLYNMGSNILVTGAASDPEDGTLSASSFSWQVIIHHNTHTHIIEQQNGTMSPSFEGPDHGSEDVYVEVKLTVTDSAGISNSTSINLYANTAPITEGNLINNPSAEIENVSQGVPHDWLKGGYGVNNAIFTYPVAGFDGDKAMRLEVNTYSDGNAKWYFNPVFVTAEESYDFSNYYTANVVSSQVAQFGFENGTYGYVQLGSLPATETPTKVEHRITVPAGVRTLTVFHELNQNGILTVDNYHLELASQPIVPATTTILFKGGFETDSFSEWDSGVGSNFTISGGTCRMGPDTNLKAVMITGANVGGTQTLTKALSTVGYENLKLSFCYKWDVLESEEGVAIEYTADGINWNLLKDINNTTVRHMMYSANDTEIADSNGVGEIPTPHNLTEDELAGLAISIPANASNNPLFALRLREHLSDSNDFVWIDDFQIRGVATSSTPVTPPATTTTTNLVPNPSFETAGTGGNPQSWERGGWGTNTAVFTYPVVGTDGADAARVEITSFTNGDAKWYFNPVAVQGGSKYDFGTSYKSNVSTEILIQYQTTAGVQYQFVSTLPVSASWTNFQTEITVPANATALSIFHVLHSVGFLEIDNYDLSPATTTPPVPSGLIQNPSLETAGSNGDPENWARGGWGTNNRVFTYPVAGTDGTDAARIEITSYTNGDAKWYFTDVPVTAGGTYTLSHSYRSNVATSLTARYTRTDGSVFYAGIVNLPASTSWTNTEQTLAIPAQVTSITIFHALINTGWLEIDNFGLSSGASDTFANGMVSLSFDDGWLSQYTDALPILNAVDMDGTFYIVSDETALAVPDERIQNPSLETAGTNGDPENWARGGWGTNNRAFTYPVAGIDGADAARVEITSYTNGDAKWYFGDATVIPNQDYLFQSSYNSNVSSEVVIRYTSTTGAVSYSFLASLPSTGSTWQNFGRSITIPANTYSMTVFHLISGVGSLSVDNYSLKRVQVYLSPAQMLEIQASGHEIGSHTKTHPDLALINSAELLDEVSGSRTDLLGLGVNSISTIAYPLGSYNSTVENAVTSAGYSGARSVDRGFNTKTTSRLALKIQQVDRTTTIADIQSWVNQAIADKTWLILMFHQIDQDMEATLGITPAFLQQIVNYIDSTNVNIVTVHEGVSLMNP